MNSINNSIFINLNSFSNIEILLISLFFLSVGSFCSSVIFRLAPENDLNLFKPRSFCPSCNKTIHIINLIPLLGFLIQKGKCMFCRTKISKFYPFSEIFFLLFGVLLIANYGISLATIIYTIIILCFYVLFFLDYKYFYLPVSINILLIIIGIVFNAKYGLFIDEASLILNIKPILFSLYGLFFGYSSLWLVNFIYKISKKKNGIGGGDFILFGAIGSIFGPFSLPIILLIGSFLGCLYFIFSRKNIDNELPLGSFLVFSSFIYFLYNFMNFS